MVQLDLTAQWCKPIQDKAKRELFTFLHYIKSMKNIFRVTTLYILHADMNLLTGGDQFGKMLDFFGQVNVSVTLQKQACCQYHI